jgi:DNA processing protein
MTPDYSIKLCNFSELPKQLLEIPQPPKKMYRIGTIPQAEKYLAVVGSRKLSDYGKEVCTLLLQGLKDTPTIIVSGLALGIDCLAHETALANGLKTIAVPGSGLNPDVLYPYQNRKLAYNIVDAGGALISEFEPKTEGAPWTFPQRNRIMAGLSHAVLVIEASEKSGTLITARFGLDYNRDVLAVPGAITSPTSQGTNKLLRQGALAITSADDLREALGYGAKTIDTQQSLFKSYDNCSQEELKLIEILRFKQIPKDVLIRESTLPIVQANIALSMLEMKGIIEERLGVILLK